MTAPPTGPLAGLTWDHPRGYGPLQALEQLDHTFPAGPGGKNHPYGSVTRPVAWSRHALEGFESTPLATLADDYDLVVIDHPHLADAVYAHALVPLDEVVPAATLTAWATSFAGPSFASYQHQGRTWALPIDAATQVLAARPTTPSLDTWTEVQQYATANPGSVLLCVAGPHATSTYISILVGMDQPVAADPAEFVDRSASVEALEFLRELHAHCSPGNDELNPIAALQRMTDDPTIQLIPLIFGYVNYSVPDAPGLPVRFRDAPAWREGARRGSVLGGTGLAVTRHGGKDPAAVAEHLSRLADPRVQAALFPTTGGQPATDIAWRSDTVNAGSHSFYRATRSTLDEAWVRPRRLGWNQFYDRTAAVIRGLLHGRCTPKVATDLINERYANLP